MRLQLSLILSVAFLFSFGLLMVFNTTSAEILDRCVEGSTHAPFFRQCLYGMVGIAIGALVYALGYESLIQYSPWLLAIATVCLLLLFVPGIGQTINGSRRWLHWGREDDWQRSEEFVRFHWKLPHLEKQALQ